MRPRVASAVCRAVCMWMEGWARLAQLVCFRFAFFGDGALTLSTLVYVLTTVRCPVCRPCVRGYRSLTVTPNITLS
jgi:hypothetical protein